MPIKGEKERRREDKKNREREKTGRDTERCASERPQSEAHDKMGISGRINTEMEREEGREKATLRDWVARNTGGIQLTRVKRWD